MGIKTCFLFALSLPLGAEAEFRPIFNGRDLTGWTPVLENAASGKDPQGLVSVHDGVIHMYRDLPENSVAPFGVIVSDDSYSRYHLKFDYRWMGKKFSPRKDAIRDAGLIYHAYKWDRVWPSGIENQIQEGDTGDLIWCHSNGFTWIRPGGQYAPEGQGDPGLLPEFGGVLRQLGFNYEYIGRFPEYDNLQGWTSVDTIVQADEWAIHKVNGRISTRLRDFKKPGGSNEPLAEGKITLQLEGAEIQYRNVRIRDLEEPLRPSLKEMGFSAAHGETSTQSISLTNPGENPVEVRPQWLGQDPGFFSVSPASTTLAAGATAVFEVSFHPQGHGGRYSAGIQLGPEETGAFVPVNGLGFGDGTQPDLQEILDALAIPADVPPGREHPNGGKTATWGKSIHARSFIPLENGRFYLQPLAAFPDEGSADPVLRIFDEVDTAPRPVDSAFSLQPGLQPVVPRFLSGEWEPPETSFLSAPDAAFGLTCGGSSTDWSKNGYAVRIYPAGRILERSLSDAYVLCFETGGARDYNDAIFLLGNVAPWRLPEPPKERDKKSQR